MKIVIDRKIKATILGWLQQGYIDTDNVPELNKARDDWFLELMKQCPDEEQGQDISQYVSRQMYVRHNAICLTSFGGNTRKVFPYATSVKETLSKKGDLQNKDPLGGAQVRWRFGRVF